MMARLLLWALFLPFQLLLLAVFTVVEGLRVFRFPARGPVSSDPVRNRNACTLIVLNWNGRELLAESLPALEKAVHFAGGAHRILMVDNGSDDGSVEWTRQRHPRVEILPLPENLGFGEGNNRGVEAAETEIVVLLNNDMIVEEDFLPPLLQAFADPQVFAATSQIRFPAGRRREETGWTKAQWRRGYLHLAHGEPTGAHLKRPPLPVLWAGGGSSAFHRSRFLELGGFAGIFSPCYLEDTDLSYRAWRRGWKAVFCPASRLLHKHRSTSGRRFQADRLKSMVETRKLWYLWRNYQLRSLAGHLLWLPLNFRSFLRTTDYLRALSRLPATLWTRWREPRRFVGDRELFNWIECPIRYLDRFHGDRARERQPRSPLRILVVSAYLPHLGKHGGAGRVFQLLRRVADHHRVTLISFVESEEELAELTQVEPYCERVETVFRRRFQPLSFYPYEPFEEFNCLNFRRRLIDLLGEEDFDVVHFEWTQMALYRDLVPNTPKIITEIEVNYAAHQSLVHVEPSRWKKIRLQYNTLQTLYREIELCRQVERVVCVTDADRDFLAGYVSDSKLTVVNTGVDTTYFTPGPEERIDPNAIVYVGAFRHEPNVDAMRYFHREVFPLILRQHPKTHLYIVGSSPPQEIKALGRSRNVTVTGFVDDIREYYDLAQVVIVPLRTGVGIRGKILEGWAAGKAMVATPLACLGIRALHGENILIAETADQFGMWTAALLRHPEHCRSLGLAGRRMAVEHYEWDQLGKDMSRVYESLFGEAGVVEECKQREEVLKTTEAGVS